MAGIPAWTLGLPEWALQLVANIVIPDNATVVTGIDFADLDSGESGATLRSQTGSDSYPGIIPNYSIETLADTKTTGIDYVIKLKKAVGFHSCLTTILSYDAKRINSWDFPIDRKKFGFIAIGRDDKILTHNPISYAREYHHSDLSLSLLLNYNDKFDKTNLFDNADKLVATKAFFYLSPGVVLRSIFLPVWEVWALKFFRAAAEL